MIRNQEISVTLMNEIHGVLEAGLQCMPETGGFLA